MNKSIVMDTCVVFYGRLWHEVLVGCRCAFRMVDCPRVVSTVHVQITRLYDYVVWAAVVQDLYVGYFAKAVV